MRLVRWCGMALVVAGVLMVAATLLHPSRETAESIIATEPRLVAAQVCYTLAWFWSWLACPGSIRLTAASWDDWDWQVCWLASWAPI